MTVHFPKRAGLTYTMTRDDFDECYLERRDDGVLLATGICPRGDRVEDTPLGVPLCSGCDNEIDASGFCHGCEEQRLFEPTQGDPLLGIAAE